MMEKDKLTIEQLSSLIAFIIEKINKLEGRLDQLTNSKPQTELLNINQAATLLNLSVSTIYSKVCKGELPVLKPGRKLHFDKSELLDYIKAGKKETKQEIETLSAFFYKKHTKRKANRRF